MNIDLNQLLEEAGTLARYEHPDPSHVAGVALELARTTTLILEALEPLKDALRAHASSHDPSPGDVVEVRGVIPAGAYEDVGAVTVTFPHKKVKLNEFGRRNWRELERQLGLHLGDLFEDHRPRKEFADRVLHLPSEMQDYVLRCVDVIEPTPRVGFNHLH